jgi:hypothetical protein
MAYLFLMDGIARKKLPARAGVLNGHWHWPSLPTADAFRDDKSDVEAMRAGLTTRTAIIAKNGDGTFEDVLARGTQEAIAIEIATQDANRELVRRGYKPTVADLNIAQDTANPAQQSEPAPEANKPQGEAPANATAALAFDEGKHPRADDGKFGSGGGGAKKGTKKNQPEAESPKEKEKTPDEEIAGHESAVKSVQDHIDAHGTSDLAESYLEERKNVLAMSKLYHKKPITEEEHSKFVKGLTFEKEWTKQGDQWVHESAARSK